MHGVQFPITCMLYFWLQSIYIQENLKYCSKKSIACLCRMMAKTLYQLFHQALHVNIFLFFPSHSTWNKDPSKTQILMTNLIIAEWRSPWTKWDFQRRRKQIFSKWLLLCFMLEILPLRTVETLKVCGGKFRTCVIQTGGENEQN